MIEATGAEGRRIAIETTEAGDRHTVTAEIAITVAEEDRRTATATTEAEDRHTVAAEIAITTVAEEDRRTATATTEAEGRRIATATTEAGDLRIAIETTEVGDRIAEIAIAVAAVAGHRAAGVLQNVSCRIRQPKDATGW